MPQRKPVMVKNPRHVDGIREMIDFVRTQQGPPVAREATCTDLTLRRRAPLPEIGQPLGPLREPALGGLGGGDTSLGIPGNRTFDIQRLTLEKESTFDVHQSSVLRDSYSVHAPVPGLERETAIFKSSDTDNTDTDPAYESDDDLDLDLRAARRAPCPARRSNSVLSAKSTHALGLSYYSMDAAPTSSSQLGPGKGTRKLSLQDSSPLTASSTATTATRRPSRTLPPVRKSTLERTSRGGAHVPQLDLTDVPTDLEDPMTISRPSAPSPGSASSRDGDDSLAEDGRPIDFIDSR